MPHHVDPDEQAYLRFMYHAMRRKVLRRALIWTAVAVATGLISLATYASAQQEAAAEAARTGSGSGTYFIWWGPMVFGGWKALRHFWTLGEIARWQRTDTDLEQLPPQRDTFNPFKPER